jgi:hypothetical protein
MKNTLLILCGAVAGAVLGYFGVLWVAQYGFYALILPGALVGFGAGIVRNPSFLLAVVCGVLAVGAGLFTEWRFSPWVEDDSLGFFLRHIHDKNPVKLLMIAVGGFIGFWVPFRRIEK